MNHVRYCAICGTRLEPFTLETMTGHEFRCYKLNPERVPWEHMDQYHNQLDHERRSEAAFRGVATRRAKGGKRAQR